MRDDPLSHAAVLTQQGFGLALQLQFAQAIGFHRRPAVQDSRIGPGHVDQRRFGCAKRQGRSGGEVAFQAESGGDLAHLVAAHGLGHLDGGDVAAFGQRLGQGDQPLEFLVIVGRGIGAGPGDVDRQGRVFDIVGRAPAQIQRGRIDKGFERRTGLAQRLCRAVETSCRSDLAPADHGTHRAIRTHDHDGGLRLGAFLQLGLEDVIQRLFGRLLQALVQRGADHHILGRFGRQEGGHGFHHPVGEKSAGFGGRRFGQLGGAGARLGGLFGGQVALFLHQAHHDGRPRLRALQVVGGGKG